MLISARPSVSAASPWSPPRLRPHTLEVSKNLTAIGRGSTMVGLLCIVASSKTSRPWLLLAGQLLAGLGIVLLLVHFWMLWKQRRP